MSLRCSPAGPPSRREAPSTSRAGLRAEAPMGAPLTGRFPFRGTSILSKQPPLELSIGPSLLRFTGVAGALFPPSQSPAPRRTAAGRAPSLLAPATSRLLADLIFMSTP